MPVVWRSNGVRHIFFGLSMPGTPELLIIALVVLLLFGAAKIPAIARSLGQAIKEFKKASKDESSEDKDSKKSTR